MSEGSDRARCGCCARCALQGEVLGAEAALLGRPLIRISETRDPAARSFSFAVRPLYPPPLLPTASHKAPQSQGAMHPTAPSSDGLPPP